MAGGGVLEVMLVDSEGIRAKRFLGKIEHTSILNLPTEL